MHYYKIIRDGRITQAGSQSFPVQETETTKPITHGEYESLVAEWKAHAEMVQSYAEKIQSGEITLDDVPEDCKAEVEAIITAPIPPTPEDAAVESLLQKVSEI